MFRSDGAVFKMVLIGAVEVVREGSVCVSGSETACEREVS
jgi:hypothetical protein